jgi:hypothetical protein
MESETEPTANEEAVKQALIAQLGLELVPAHKSVEILVVKRRIKSHLDV